MKPALDKSAERYDRYVAQAAKKLNCKKEDIEPYVYMVFTAVANYMIFYEDSLIYPQIKITEEATRKIVASSSKSD